MRPPILVSACFGLLVSAVLLAGATSDLRIDTDRDARQNKIFKLVNTGERNVSARVEHEKVCSGVANRRKPSSRTYRLGPRASVELAKVWRNSTCEHSFRVVEAHYR